MKFLRAFGWDPVVLTVSEGKGFFNLTDPTLLRDVPAGVPVHRAKELFRKKDHSQEPMAALSQSRQWSLVRWLGQMILVPDVKILWLPTALWKGWRLIKKHRPQAIFSTSSYYSNHLVGYLLHRLTHLPWTADFQDPWTDNPYRNWPNLWRKKIEQVLEKMVLSKASCVTATTAALAQQLSQKIPKEGSKISVITNGYDPEDFRKTDRVLSSRTTILHNGSLYQQRSALGFLQGFGEWATQNNNLSSPIELIFMGSIDPVNKNAMKKIISRCHLQDSVRFLPPMPYRVGLEMVQEADVLLLVTDPGEGGQNLVPTKLYEYLFTAKPIIALVPKEGECARLITATSQGMIVDQDDPAQIHKALDAVAHKSLSVAKSSEVVAEYHWKNLTEKLAGVLNKP